MKFVDMVRIHLKAGNGGNGCMSFRREKFIAMGGPDGGNGGRGGDIYIEAAENIHSLTDFQYNKRFTAKNGLPGSGKNRYGSNGDDVTIYVPCGTIVYNADKDYPMADLVDPGDRVMAARGGRGGKGNLHFASSVRRAPRFCEKGSEGEDLNVRLELKLIADVGLVGLPNAGKSSLLKALSNANPKIAGYPFTTLSPNLGVLAVDDQKIVIADVPGLIEGAHENKGLGHFFLRHIERTRVIVHVLDMSSQDFDDIVGQWNIVLGEFRHYNDQLLTRPYMVVLNKLDLVEDSALVQRLTDFFGQKGVPVCVTSAVDGRGIDVLMKKLIAIVRENPRPKGSYRLYDIPVEVDSRSTAKAKIVKEPDGSYRVIHPRIEEAASRYNFEQDEAIVRFMRLLRQFKVEEKLEEAGAVEGDTVHIGDTSFDFEPETVGEMIGELEE